MRVPFVKGKQRYQIIERRCMIPPNLNYVQVDSQPAHMLIVAVPVRFGTLTLMKQQPPAAKPQGVMGPLVEGPGWIARPTCGRAMRGCQHKLRPFRWAGFPRESSLTIVLLKLPAH